jgi:hypothetical protein
MAVRTVWKDKFLPRRGPGPPRQPRQSNVDLAILNSQGKVVYWFDAMQHQGPPRQSLAQYTNRELAKAADQLNLRSQPVPRRTIRLPDLEQSRGVRIFVSLKDDRMRAYQAPIVEVVALNDQDWKNLEYSDQTRTVSASSLMKWMSQVYPSGVMERTDPRTKEVYRIKSVTGDLTQSPAGSNDTYRYALLSGIVQLTDEGPDNFNYSGKVEIVLTYKKDPANVFALRGVFEGIYPRFDRMRRETRKIPLHAVFESRPN